MEERLRSMLPLGQLAWWLEEWLPSLRQWFWQPWLGLQHLLFPPSWGEVLEENGGPLMPSCCQVRFQQLDQGPGLVEW